MLVFSFRVSVETLRGNPLRTFLSTLGIVTGVAALVAALVAVLSLADGMASFMRQQIGATTDLQAIVVGVRTTREVDGVAVPLDTIAGWTPGAAAALRRAVPQEADVGLVEAGVVAVSMVDGVPRAPAAGGPRRSSCRRAGWRR
ncbi:MAG: hypothetical protein JWL60_630 [Gemmatimonadetes bacterium]|nr:hypothetical protein [Gemmatimonadota bacterium]